MQVYQTDQFGFLVGVTTADPDPLDAGNWLIPGGCVTVEPPQIPDGKLAKWEGGEWTLVDQPAPPEPEPEPEPTIEELRARMSLSFAQLLIGLVTEQWLTATEARAWRDRVALPQAVLDAIAELPAEVQFAAETRAMAPSEIRRIDPLVDMMRVAVNKTPEQLDEFFNMYSGV